MATPNADTVIEVFGTATDENQIDPFREQQTINLPAEGDVFIAGEGDIVDRRYKILHITPVSVEVEDVLNNNRQSIPLTQG